MKDENTELSSDEVSMLKAIAEQAFPLPSSLVYVRTIINDEEQKSAFANIDRNILLLGLKAKGIIEYGFDGKIGDLRITDNGWAWLKENRHDDYDDYNEGPF